MVCKFLKVLQKIKNIIIGIFLFFFDCYLLFSKLNFSFERLYYFVAKNEEERREWIEILGRYCLDDNLRPVLFFDPLIGSSRALLLYIYLNKIQIGMRALNLKIEPKVIPKDFLELSPTKIVPLLNIKNENKKFVGR